MAVFPVTVNLGERRYTLIGEITVQWALLEWQLRMAIGLLRNIDPKTARVDGLGIKDAEYMAWINEDITKGNIQCGLSVDFLKKLETDFDAAKTARNALSHGIWLTLPGVADPAIQLAKGKNPDGTDRRRTPAADPVPVKALESDVARIKDLNDRVHQLRVGIKTGGNFASAVVAQVSDDASAMMMPLQLLINGGAPSDLDHASISYAPISGAYPTGAFVYDPGHPARMASSQLSTVLRSASTGYVSPVTVMSSLLGGDTDAASASGCPATIVRFKNVGSAGAHVAPIDMRDSKKD